MRVATSQKRHLPSRHLQRSDGKSHQIESGHQILEFVLPLGYVCCELAVAAFLRGTLMIGKQLLRVNQISRTELRQISLGR